MSVYDTVRDHHAVHGDDFGDTRSRAVRYDAALSLFPRLYDNLLDVGCGSGKFRIWWNGSADYTGIDLLNGQNVLDHKLQHDLVVALGVLYRVPLTEQYKLIRHMWKITRVALIVQTLCNGEPCDDEWPMPVGDMFNLAMGLTGKIALRTDYHPRDMTIALYR